jgi:AraC-like DNA-binding protein
MDIDGPVGAHAHPQCHALCKIDGDDTFFEVEGRRYAMTADSVVLVNAWQPHSYPFTPGARGRARVLALYIEPAWLGGLEPSFGASARRDFFPRACVAAPAPLRQRMHGLAEELSASRTDSRRAYLLLQRVVIEIALGYSNHRDIPGWARAATATVGDHRIRRAMDVLAERVADRLDMGAVAREAAMSRPHFFETFRRALGITPNAYRNVLRMERGYRALLDTAAPVGKIAVDLGFHAHAHFTRFFRHNHGVAPEAYRDAAWRIE